MRPTGFLTAFLVLVAGGAGAADYRYDTSYKVSLGVLPIARMTFQTAVENERYTISGQFHSSSLVDIVREVSADSTVSGRMSGGAMSPERYVLDYKSGKRNHVYEVLFAGGNVVGSFPSLVLGGTDDGDLGKNGRFVPTIGSDQVGATLLQWLGLPSSNYLNVFPDLANYQTKTIPLFRS